MYLSAKQLKSQRLEILLANSPEDSWNYNPSAGFIPAFSTNHWFSELKKTKFINWYKKLIVGVKMLNNDLKFFIPVFTVTYLHVLLLVLLIYYILLLLYNILIICVFCYRIWEEWDAVME